MTRELTPDPAPERPNAPPGTDGLRPSAPNAAPHSLTAEQRLRMLWEAAAVLLTTDEPDAMLRRVFERIAPHLGLDTYFNYMVSEAGDSLRLASCVGIPDEVARVITRLEFGQAICGMVALRREPIIATHIQETDDPKAQLVRSFGIRAYACNPLMAGGNLLGTLSFASRTRDEFEEEELEFLRTICRYVTAACERLQLISRLREADRRKDEFLATLAHELRNPLAPIRNGLEVMRIAPAESPMVGEARGMMERQVGQMVRLIDDLLDMSRISRGKIELRKERVELGRVVQHAVETSRPQIETSSHELTIDLPAEPVYVEADPARLAQVLSNLLTNSAKFTPRGGRIRLSVERQGSDAVIRVRDSGIGIAEEMLPRVFEIFSQVDRTMESAHGGLGIGLSIVRGIVELHGGSVEARSDGPGRGSEFAIRLSAILPTPPVRLAAIEGVVPEGGPARRILIVDDNRDAARSLALLLALRGHETQVAHDGIEALHAAETFRPAILFLDIGMPRLNGYAAAERLRQTDWGRALTIVALTGWGQEGDKQRSSAAGIDFHLVKPVDPDEVDRLLARIGPMDLERSESAPPH